MKFIGAELSAKTDELGKPFRTCAGGRLGLPNYQEASEILIGWAIVSSNRRETTETQSPSRQTRENTSS